MQILVFVAMIAVYSLSSILKAKTKKKEPVTGEQKPRRPRPAGPVPRPQYRQGTQSQRGKISRPQLNAQNSAVKSEKPKIKPKRPSPVQQPQQDIFKAPKQQLKTIKHPEITSDSINYKDKRVIPSVPDETTQTITYFADDFLDVNDPDALRRAILHYEILGKPLSLLEQQRAF